MTAASEGKTATVTLPSDRQILITREFDAPAHLVFKAFTTPELVGRWWSADMGETTLVAIDLRVGGAWRYVMVTHDGVEVAFHGEYLEVVPNERLVSTEVYENLPPDVPQETAVNTATFTEENGRTILTILVTHSTREHRDGHLKSGMEGGLQKALHLLESVARGLA
ncbi:SRPBCC family protein [Deinococcus yavapaiensis]|uniref:Uncharacterized protein YndB with AHSA1/START domain n=1 Tax=Deinococcus yavapaiensis KR-236 TaxID=694435 RepID=A0A318SCK3_9DEIO|nr:SRPBCC family protein [Deinococcus yavapaiensis]PYE56591.1 uncharacterized protein YndB with AHSA1/START domain [Deinococcus yavapaiensis KR-236]